MNQHYTHLTEEERYQIYAFKKAGFTNQSIADELHRHISTIKRELKRNKGLRGYRPKQAHRLAQKRQASKPKAIKLTPSLKRIGDWEADTVIGRAHKGVIITLTERYSRLTLIAKTNTKKASVVSQAIVKLLKPYQDQLKTITYDNGKEFAYHEEVAKQLNVSSYFTHPYSSWERGLNENHNGLIRQYLPKREPFDDVSSEKICWIEKRLNNRPKKVLHFQTPNEVYSAMCA